ncbi:MAG: orotidine-5'-phosphate decarboxylase [Salibacteraceae bacterium]|nr:orotidine-5'-phosphate decarboxylase [Salibacteraceae bacterium]MDP4935519.1 orotidine-5'-phosphate decarboxylase [Salibacteraceae bacterium]MDP4963596.1 orotidine-5'-phosphate decarboxylase [Salibacteraceae bacterium]
MSRKELFELILRKQSFLCVGLDTDPEKLPKGFSKDAEGVYAFNKAIIEATLPYSVSYKFNIAFYEALGIKGWEALERSIKLIPKGEALIIADAKRGDIGNTAAQYAKAFFETLDCDAITINPYMGKDSVTPFLKYHDKWSIVLGLTSNEGAKDIELLTTSEGEYVFEAAMKNIVSYASDENLMFVVGATQPEYFKKVRDAAPNHFFLVPGVGAQGGTLEDLAQILTKDCGLLVNSSRGIIYASSESDFAEAAANAAKEIQQKMSLKL